VEFGLMRPSCRAAEKVTSLNTEPGSYSWVTARLFGASSTASLGPMGTTPAVVASELLAGVLAPSGVGWVATKFAMERIWPVLTSITTAVPLTEFEDSIALANACSDSYWSWLSSVSSSPVPGVVATLSVTGDCGIVTPAGDFTIVSLPSVPANSVLFPYSRPAAPWPDPLVKPITGAARFPLGT